MKLTCRKLLGVSAALLLILAMIPLLSGKAFAAVEFGNYDPAKGLRFETAWDQPGRTVWIKEGSEKISSVEGYDKSIIHVEKHDDYLWITVYGDGTTTITVHGAEGGTADVKVIVEAGYMNHSIKEWMDLHENWYGTKRIEVYGRSATSGTLTVGKDKYKVKKLGSDHKYFVKLKKRYKKGTKITLKLKYGKYSATRKFKIDSMTAFDEVRGSKKTIKVKIYNLHKGDIVKVSYKGKTYKKKIGKDYNEKYKNIKFKVKNKVKKTAKITITIKNKYKQVLDKNTVKLQNGFFEYPDEDEDPEGDEPGDEE